jgi:hypothetical protein
MVRQHPVGETVGHQFHRTNFFHGARVHGFQHVASDFGLVMIMQLFVNTGHGLHIAGYYQQVVADHQYSDVLIEFS